MNAHSLESWVVGLEALKKLEALEFANSSGFSADWRGLVYWRYLAEKG